jgi:SAM-dependent methyltransferase
MTLYLGIFFVTLSGLLFEIALTRIFSATIWYHFTFVAISVALLGWGLSGFALHALKNRLQPSIERAALFTLLYAASIPLSLWLIVRLPFLPDRLTFYFAVSLVPFFLAGLCLSTVFALHRDIAGRLYFADLLGASVGALAVTGLLSWLGGENAVLAIALFPILGSVCFSRRYRAPAGLLAVLVLAAIATNERTGLFMIKSAPTKGMYQHLAKYPDTKVVLTGWNAYSRIDAVVGFPSPYIARLYIDSDAWTNVLRWDGKIEDNGGAAEWYRALPFKIAPKNPQTLIIGPGGGSDVLVALAAGSAKVTAVEMNPLMLSFVRHFGAEAGNIYDHPKVEAILSEGRTFISRTDRLFDVILLGFVDSWAAVASGGLSLSENHLYTVEAFQAYYDRLKPDGMLVILRWNVDIPRLISNAIALLGPQEAGKRIVVLLEERTDQEPPQMIFMLRKRAFTEAETAEIMDQWKGARPVIVPGRRVEKPFDDLLSGRKTTEQFAAEAETLVEPVFDNRPFFFARQKPWGLPESMTRAFRNILLPIAFLCVVFVALGKPAAKMPAGPYAASVVYFSCLGLGFIAVELVLLHHLTLLLGHPIFTLSILLFTLLAAGGLGSYASPHFQPWRVCLVITSLGVLYALVLPRVVPALLPLSLPARIAIAIALIAPLGFAMGMPFPRGLRETGRGALPAPPFYWGLNGILSVVGSLGTMTLAVTCGFTAAMLAGCACYAVASAVAPYYIGSCAERRAA